VSEFIVGAADEARIARAHAGADRCRAAIADVVTKRQAERPQVPLSPSEQILQRARQRADGERRAARARELDAA
jgi:hypothetical protein